MGLRLSKPQRQPPPLSPQTSRCTLPSIALRRLDQVPALLSLPPPSTTPTPVSAIVITICMLKVGDAGAMRHNNDNDDDVAAAAAVDDGNRGVAQRSSCWSPQQLLVNNRDQLVADNLQSASLSASASSSSSTTVSPTDDNQTSMVVAAAAIVARAVIPPLIRMRDIAGDSSADDDEDDDDVVEYCDDAVAHCATTRSPNDNRSLEYHQHQRQQQQQLHDNNGNASLASESSSSSSSASTATQRQIPVIAANNYRATALTLAANPDAATTTSNANNNCGESATASSSSSSSWQPIAVAGDGNCSESAGLAATHHNSSSCASSRANGISNTSSSDSSVSSSFGATSVTATHIGGGALCRGQCQEHLQQQQHHSNKSPAAVAPVKIKKTSAWKLNCAKLITGKSTNASTSLSSATSAAITSGSSSIISISSTASASTPPCVVCTAYRRMDERDVEAAAVHPPASPSSTAKCTPPAAQAQSQSPSATAVGSANIRLLPPSSYPEPAEDCDETARQRRAREIANGIDAPPGFRGAGAQTAADNASAAASLATSPSISSSLSASNCRTPVAKTPALVVSKTASTASAAAQAMLQSLHSASPQTSPTPPQQQQQSQPHYMHNQPQLGNAPMESLAEDLMPRLIIHSQVDYVHCLVPDLRRITASAFYWGKMDRYEAERLLDGKPEGTFLLRDSAQEEFLFSVSFRKYGRSLHARIEQFNHKFSFDCHDPGVYTSASVTGLLEHYKDPACVMFFEPALTLPLTRNNCFALQELCRAAIVSRTTYDGVGELSLPVTLKAYLREYHYRQRVRVQRFDESIYGASSGGGGVGGAMQTVALVAGGDSVEGAAARNE